MATINDALQGTSGTPSNTNRYVTDDDPRIVVLENVAASKLIGRGSAAGAGIAQEITLGTNLSMAGTTLNATGGGGGGETFVQFMLMGG